MREEEGSQPVAVGPTGAQQFAFWLVAFVASFSLAAGIASLYASTVSGGGFEGKAGYAWLFALPLSYVASVLLLAVLYAFVRKSGQRLMAATVALAFVALPGVAALLNVL